MRQQYLVEEWVELLAYIKLRGRLGPPRRDDDLAWLAAYASSPHQESVSIDEFRPERGIDTPQPEVSTERRSRRG